MLDNCVHVQLGTEIVKLCADTMTGSIKSDFWWQVSFSASSLARLAPYFSRQPNAKSNFSIVSHPKRHKPTCGLGMLLLNNVTVQHKHIPSFLFVFTQKRKIIVPLSVTSLVADHDNARTTGCPQSANTRKTVDTNEKQTRDKWVIHSCVWVCMLRVCLPFSVHLQLKNPTISSKSAATLGSLQRYF